MRNDTTIFLSLVITTYKRNAWLQDCLDSIFVSCSEYYKNGGEQKIEVIVCDDDPKQSDDVKKIFENKFNQFKIKFIYQVNETNLGDYFNRNRGLSLGSGKWVKFIDDDDILYPWSIEFMIGKLTTSTNSSCVIFYLRDNFRHLFFPIVLEDKEIIDFHYLQYGLFHCSLVSSVFLRSEIVNRNAFKFRRFYGDFQIFHDMAANGIFIIYPVELGWYRIHEEQESNNNRKKVWIQFNYLLYSVNYFLHKETFDIPYAKALLFDTVATIKHAIKKCQPLLLFQAVYLAYILRFKRAKNDRSEKFMKKWTKFYNSKILYSNNETLKGSFIKDSY